MRRTPVIPRALPVALSLVLAAAPASAVDRPPARLVTTLPGGALTDVATLTVSLTFMAVGNLALSPPSGAHVAPLDGLGHRDRDDGVGLASDLVLGVGGLGAVAASLGGELAHGARGWDLLRAPLVLTESALLSIGVVSLVKNVGVCRPRAWSDATATCDSAAVDDRRAFPSGHTAPLAALSGASLGMWLLPSGRRDPWAAGLFAVTTAMAVATLTLRVAAGAHSWVDTGVGFGLGFGLGITTAALHVRRAPVSVAVAGSGVVVSGVW